LCHAYGARANDRHVFVSGALDGRDRVAAVVANQMQNVNAVQLASFTIGVVVLAAGQESNNCVQSAHG
jgi:hypothetical protein